MKITAIAILILLAAGSAYASARSVSIAVGGSPITLETQPLIIENEVYAPLALLSCLQISYKKPAPSDQNVVITPPNNSVFEIPTRTVAGHGLFPLLFAADKLGYYADWDQNTGRIDLRSKICAVEYNDGKVSVQLGYPCKFALKEFKNPRRLVIDISGAQLVGPSETRDIGASELPMLKIGQYETNTARVVLHLGEKTGWKCLSSGEVRDIEILLENKIEQPKTLVKPDSKIPAKTAVVSSIHIETDEHDRVEVLISADAPLSPKSFFLSNPDRVCLDLTNAKLSSDIYIPEIKSSLLSVSRLGEFNKKLPTVRFTFEVNRIPAYSVIRRNPNEVSLLIRIPDNAGGSLKDKFIVIDPGHGGYQPGARFGDVLEKEINLAVAKKLAERLKMIGARVSLTREDDSYVSLGDRPKLAEDLGADLFISIHCNSNGNPESLSGTETYYHKDDPSSRALAQCVQTEVVKALGLPNRNAKSDSSLSSIGLKVLRCATVPAVLLELGFLNHTTDRRKLLDAKGREAAAEGILNGLRYYVEGEVPAKEDLVESKSPKS